MIFEILMVTARSVTIELQGDSIYYAKNPYNVYLNNRLMKTGETHNVTSLYGLEPETDYTIKVVDELTDGMYSTHVTTSYESVRLNVKKFGAVGDGTHLDSMAIQAAIMACPESGTVYIPKGVYYCGPLFLKSNMLIELEEGAEIKGHIDRAVYPILPGYLPTSNGMNEYYLGTWEGNPLDCHASLITGIGVTNVAIVGSGIINGNANNSDWWINPKIRQDAWRPRTVFLNGCNNIRLQGLTVKNSPSWTLHPFFSDNIDFIDLKVVNHKDSPNTDGLDPESCSNVRIIGIDFSVGDDCIAIKAGKLYMGKKTKQPSKDFVIRNCHMKYGHGAVVIGSEMSGGVKNIHVSKCLFEATDRGLRIKTRRGRGEDAVIDNITFDNIKMDKVLTPLVINMFYFCDPDGKSEYVYSREKLPVDEWTPYLGKFTFTNIQCENSEVAAACFHGLPEQPIEEVIMENVTVNFTDDAKPGQAAMMSNAEDLCRRGIIAENVVSLKIDNVNINNYIGELTEII